MPYDEALRCPRTNTFHFFHLQMYAAWYFGCQYSLSLSIGLAIHWNDTKNSIEFYVNIKVQWCRYMPLKMIVCGALKPNMYAC